MVKQSANCQWLTVLSDHNDIFERQKPFVYVTCNSSSATVLHGLKVLLKTQNPDKQVVFKMVNRLKYNKDDIIVILTLFDIGGMMGPQDVFDHCAQMLKKRKLKLGDF